ncbi:thioredoxin family protein [bacterium]|nr:thioredoxin family protein [bacterium]
MIHLNNKNFEEKTKTGLKLVLFSAKWCGYCQKQKMVLNTMPDIWVGEIDTDESPELTEKYGIMSFPTFVLFKNGQGIAKFVGLHNKSELLNQLMKYMN